MNSLESRTQALLAKSDLGRVDSVPGGLPMRQIRGNPWDDFLAASHSQWCGPDFRPLAGAPISGPLPERKSTNKDLR